MCVCVYYLELGFVVGMEFSVKALLCTEFFFYQRHSDWKSGIDFLIGIKMEGETSRGKAITRTEFIKRYFLGSLVKSMAYKIHHARIRAGTEAYTNHSPQAFPGVAKSQKENVFQSSFKTSFKTFRSNQKL